jgi:DNA-binding LytR/AlgR family response regulator
MPAPTALIAEDEPLLAAGLHAELARAWPELVIAATVGDGHAAVVQALAHEPSVCFLDIRMPGQSGLEAAQELSEEWPEGRPFPLLVFVTAYDQYALQAFDAQASDYLVKPVQPARLARCVERLMQRLAARGPAPLDETALAQVRALLAAAAPPAAGGTARLEVIQAAVGSTVHIVPLAEVLYFEAADKYVRVVTASREYLIRWPLRELLPQLDPAVFWQVHRGTVVRASAIAAAHRGEAGKLHLQLRERPEPLVVSRLYAPLFKGM